MGGLTNCCGARDGSEKLGGKIETNAGLKMLTDRKLHINLKHLKNHNFDG